jgi:hypothetical protein
MACLRATVLRPAHLVCAGPPVARVGSPSADRVGLFGTLGYTGRKGNRVSVHGPGRRERDGQEDPMGMRATTAERPPGGALGRALGEGPASGAGA